MSNFRQFVRVSGALLALAMVAGCGGGKGTSGGGGGTTSTPSISVAVSPFSPLAMAAGATQVFTATVTNDSASAGVTWTATVGSINASGMYTAPTPVSTNSATVMATSRTDPSKTASVSVPLTAAIVTPISVNPISPNTVSLGVGGSQAFVVSVANDSTNSGVTWSIGSGLGTLTSSSTTGVTYNAPATAISATTTVTLTATSVKDPTKSATATITLNPISVSVVPTNVTMGGGATQAFAATVANDAANAGVNWTTVGGGSFSLSTTLSGSPTVYTAPTILAGGTVTVTATSKTDPTKTGTVTITVSPIAVSLASPSSIALDSAQTFAISATITGDASASGATFAVSGPGGGTMSASPVSGNSPSSTYTVPVIASATTSTITVASVKDPTKTQTVAVTLNPPMAFTTPQGALTAGTISTVYPGATIGVAGGTGNKTFTLSSGSLPAGLSLSTSGVISGTPTASGLSTFTVHVVDQSSSPAVLNGTFSINVNATSLVWTSPAAGTQTYTVGTPITPIALSTTGGTGAVTYSVNSGTLPQGLQIVGGQVTGTPTAPTVVTGNVVTFLATDSATPTAATSVSPSVTLIANPVPLAITSTLLSFGSVGVPYSYQLTSTGGTGAVTWSLSSGSLTGTGLTLSNSGLISGTPAVAQPGLSLTFQAKDSATNQQQTKTVSLPLNLYGALTILTTNSLPVAPVSAAYSQSFAAAGGSGSGYTWTVTAGATGANSLASLNLGVSSAGVVSGTPSIAGTANFTVQVKDASNNTASGSFTISTAPALTLPSPNPASLGSAAVNTVYSGSISASGGISGYTWTVNGGAVPTNGTSVGLPDGLSVSNSGGATLSVSGTPTATGTVTFTASIKDSAGTVAGPATYAINVNNFFTVGGQINSQVGCTTGGLNGVTVTINTNPVQTATTSANGAFSFTNVPNGTYIITPSINGSSSAFYPATETVIVNSNNLTAASITATLGYTVTGTVAYTGSQTGQIYLALNPTGNCGGRSPGTSISGPGPFTIRGVPPGNYTLQAFLDNVGDGVPNASNPVGSLTGVNVTTTNISGVAATLADPAPVTLTTAPTLITVAGFNSGAMAQYKPITNSGGLEMATYYTFQWSTSSTFATIAGSKRFFANGTHSNVWFLHGLTNGSLYYFRVYGTSAGTLQGPYSAVVGPVLITAPTVGNTVTGSVSFAGLPGGPLYVGFYDQGTAAFYGQYFSSPISPQTFTIQVPSGSDYLFVGVVDQNNDGAINANDITNTGNGTSQPITVISGNTSNENLTLPSADGIASVTTQNFESISPGGNSQNYNINFQVNGLIKQPVAASLVSGPNLITPVDIAICGGPGSSCNQGFQISFNLYGTSPAVGDNYVFNVAYSDGTTGALIASVTGVLNSFASNLAPQTGTSSSVTSTFSWTDPLNASSFTYQFYMNDSNSKAIWQIPTTNSTSNGFGSSITSIPWGTDPTGGASAPTVASLTPGAIYTWQITVQDNNGNTTVSQVQYQP